MRSASLRRKRISLLIKATLSVSLVSALVAPDASAAVQQDYQYVLRNARHLAIDHIGDILSMDGSDLRKTDKNGALIWSVRMPDVDGFPFFEASNHLIIDANNDIYVDSYFDNRSASADVVVTKINTSGTIAWGGPKVFSYGPINSSEHIAVGPMAIGSDGSIYVVGRSSQTSLPSPELTYMFRINASNGVLINSRRLADTTDLRESGMPDTTLATDASGNVYYGGPQGLWSFSPDLQTQRWTQAIIPRDIAVDSANGAIYVTGVGSAGGTTYNMFVRRIVSSTGATSWTSTFGNETHSLTYPNVTFSDPSDDRVFGGNRILLDGSGGIYAAGHGTDGAYNGGLIAKFNSSGTRQWTQHYGPNNTGASVEALAVDNLNDLYVGGQQTSPGQASPQPATREILSPVNGSVLWSSNLAVATTPPITYEVIGAVLVDGSGNTYWNMRSDSGSGFFIGIYNYRGPAVPDGTYTIVGLNSGMALDDPNFSRAAGEQMIQWTVNNGTNQKWVLTNFGNNTIRLVNQASGYALGLRNGSTADHAAVEQNLWFGSTYQQWIVVPSATLGYFTIQVVNGGRVFEVAGSSKTAGALIDQFPSLGFANQKWHFQ